MKFETITWSVLLSAALLTSQASANVRGNDRDLVASPDNVFVVCGDPERTSASNCKLNGSFKQTLAGSTTLDTYAVRCCSDTSIGLSKENTECAVSLTPTFGYTDINGQCKKDATYEEAVSFCAAAGARLCSVNELLGSCTTGTGCGYDNYHTWTSTPYEDTIPQDSRKAQFQSDGEHFVVCGDPDRTTAAKCKKDGQWSSYIKAQDNEEYAVRCCSKDPLTSNGAKQMCSKGYGLSFIPFGGSDVCIEKATYKEAEAYCEIAGARLCTAYEILDHCTQSTGCGFDENFVWTATEFADPMPRDPDVEWSDESHLIVCGDPYRDTAGCKKGDIRSPAEEQDMETHVVRCCGDSNFGWHGIIKHDKEGCESVWGGSYVPINGEDKCMNARNYLEAKAICEDNGARLCTAAEAMSGCTQGSGCSYDNFYFWTATHVDEGYSPPTAAPTEPIDQTDEDHWLVCGDPDRYTASGCKDSNGDHHATIQASGMEDHEVRCCKDGFLDWAGAVNGQWCGDVWGGSNIPELGCVNAATWAEAERICSDAGARLCTQEELANSCAQGSGCMHDEDWVWSSTKVTPGTEVEPSFGHHYVACGNPTSTSDDCKRGGKLKLAASADSTEEHEVRCCSDNYLFWFENSPVRLNNGCATTGISEVPIIGGSIANTVCHTAKTYAQAELICSENNARLCTVEEVVGGCTRGSGCGYDNNHVWTKTLSCADEAECAALEHVDDHAGCFRHSDADKRLSLKLGTPFSIDTCFKACEKAKYAYAGLKSGSECWCGGTLDLTKEYTADVDHFCSLDCMIGDGKCGGTGAMDIFATGLPESPDESYESKYMGCLADTSNVLTKINDNMSVTECVDACTNDPALYSVAALANGSECMCGKVALGGKSTDCGNACASGKGLCGGIQGRSAYRTNNNVKPLQKLRECRGARSSWWGDPHFTTFDNLKYNCQGIGHFVLVDCVDYQLQGLFKEATGSGGRASVTDGVAARYKTFPTVAVNIAHYDDPKTAIINICPVHVFIGGELQNITAMESDIVRSVPTGFEVNFPQGGPALNVKIRKGRGCLMDVDVCIHEQCMANTVGMLGTPNNDMDDDWMFLNKTTYFPRPNNYKGAGGFDYCVNNWCVQKEGDSLFTYGASGPGFDELDDCAGSPDYPGDLDTGDLTQDEIDACAQADDPEACEMEASVGGREAIQETLDNDQDTGVDLGDDDDDDEPDDPLSPHCPEDIDLIGHIGRDFENWPIEIVSQDVTHATLKVTSPLRNTQIGANFYVQYPKISGTSDYCEAYTEVNKSWSTEIVVECMHSSPYALVHLFSADEEAYGADDDAEIFPCCHAEAEVSSHVVQYTFMVSCEAKCPTEVA